MEYGIKVSIWGSFLIYFISVFGATIFSYFAEKFQIEKDGSSIVNPKFWRISYLFLFLPLGFRGNGIDHSTYKQIFTTINSSSFRYNGFPEPLFTLINKLVNFLFRDFQFIYLIFAAITLLLIYKEIAKQINRVRIWIVVWMMSVSLYFYMYGLVRMFLAVSIIWYAHKYIEKKEWKKYLLSVVLAASFHYSSLIMIPIYFISIFKLEDKFSRIHMKNSVIFTMIIVPLSFVVSMWFFSEVISLFPWFERYEGYFKLSFELSQIKNMAWSWPLYFLVPLLSKHIHSQIENGYLLVRLHLIFTSLSIISIFYPIFRLTFFLSYVGFYLYSAIYQLKFDFINPEKDKLYKKVFLISMFIIGTLYIIIVFFDSIFITAYLIPYYFNLPWI